MSSGSSSGFCFSNCSFLEDKLFSLALIYLFLKLYLVYVRGREVCVMTHMWRSEDNSGGGSVSPSLGGFQDHSEQCASWAPGNFTCLAIPLAQI